MDIKPKKILIIKPSSLGDIVQSLPVASALKEQFAAAEITWLVNDSYVELLGLCPAVDKVIPFFRERWGRFGRLLKNIAEWRKLVGGIRRERFDLVIDLQGLLRSGLLTAASGAPLRLGFRDAREGAWLFYNHRVQLPPALTQALKRYLFLLHNLGCAETEPVFNIKIPPELMQWAGGQWQDSSLYPFHSSSPPMKSGGGPRIAVCPGGRWRTKRWPAAKYAQLLNKFKGKVILVGAAADREVAAEIIAQLSGKITDLTGATNLVQLAAILAQADILITNDSGPMHLAAALGCPLVALFGPTDPHRTGPWTGPWGHQHRILFSDIFCRPCRRRQCPEQECMESISVELVYLAAEQILSKT